MAKDSAKIDARGRLVLPAELRQRHGISAGTTVHFLERDGEIVLLPITPAYVRSLRGLLRGGKSATRELLADRAREREGWFALHRHGR